MVYNVKGEIIGFTGDDCIVSPTWIEEAVPYFENKKIGGVQGIIAGNLFFRRKAIIEAGCFNPEIVWGEDIDLAYRVKRKGYEILFSEKSIAW